MSPLHCNTVREVLWERAASAGPEALSPVLADHLSACPACQAESRAVRELLDVSRRIPDPAPPPSIWDGFERELAERLDQSRSDGTAVRVAWERWGRRAAGLAAVLVAGFALGALAVRALDQEGGVVATPEGPSLLAELGTELANDARLEFYLDEIEDLLVAYRAAEHGEAVGVFRRSLPATMMAGPGIPSEADRQRLEAQRAAREQLRSVVLGMLASEIDAERRGFGYIDRRIAEIAGQQLLYFVH
ncbi:MAG TPA: hypothetical protein VM737_07230 [Gemmatimonadota bacterium]|nr:hypothetical protein [Gemmatimonadota bacterium]